MNRSSSRVDVVADLARLRRRLAKIEQMPAETISDRISRTDARHQTRNEIGRLEARLTDDIQNPANDKRIKSVNGARHIPFDQTS
jgi:hypothetical protein